MAQDSAVTNGNYWTHSRTHQTTLTWTAASRQTCGEERVELTVSLHGRIQPLGCYLLGAGGSERQQQGDGRSSPNMGFGLRGVCNEGAGLSWSRRDEVQPGVKLAWDGQMLLPSSCHTWVLKNRVGDSVL